MKSIIEFLATRNVDKDSISKVNINEYCIAVVFGDIAKEYEEMFDDAKFTNNANSNADFSNYWLLPIDVAKKYEEKYGSIVLYQIPDFCHNVEDIKSAGKDGRLDVDELEQIDEFK